MQKIIVTLLGSLLLMPAGSLAQESTRTAPRFADRLQTVTSKPIWEAAVREARLSAPTDATQQTPAPARSAWKRMLLGGLIGAGVGFLVISVSPECSNSAGNCGAFQLIGTSIGAGVGTVVGAVVGK